MAVSTFVSIAEQDKFRWVKYQRHEVPAVIAQCLNRWWEDLRPEILKEDVVATEKEFEFLLDRIAPNIEVYGTGTIDVVTTTSLWDWKTASRKYSEKEKQREDIQSTMYAAAATSLGMLNDWPVKFNFGVMVRDKGAHIVTVERTQSHVDWLRRLVKPLVRQALVIGTDTEWPMNDTGFLCNDTWCPFWSVCRGCHAQ